MLAQVDVTSRTEGKGTENQVPTLVKYDQRLRDGMAHSIVEDVTSAGAWELGCVAGLQGCLGRGRGAWQQHGATAEQE